MTIDPTDPLLEDHAHATAPGNRGFWIVTGTMALVAIVVVVAIFANLSMKDTIGHAQHSLRTAQAAAEAVQIETGGFGEADAAGLSARVEDLSVVGADTPSDGLDVVSVAGDAETWAAAVQARPGACFFLRLDVSGATAYGSGTLCTGREAARSADDSAW